MPIRVGLGDSNGGNGKAINYLGVYDASANNPTLVNGTGTQGDYYYVNVAGTNNPTGQLLNVGDGIAYNGFIWEKQNGSNNSTDNIIVSSNFVDVPNTEIGPGTSVTTALGILDYKTQFNPVKVYGNINVNTLTMQFNNPISYINLGTQIYTLNFINGGTLVNYPSLNGTITTAGLNPGDVYTFTRQSDNTILVS